MNKLNIFDRNGRQLCVDDELTDGKMSTAVYNEAVMLKDIESFRHNIQHCPAEYMRNEYVDLTYDTENRQLLNAWVRGSIHDEDSDWFCACH